MASFRRTLDLKNVVFKYAIAYLSHKEIAVLSPWLDCTYSYVSLVQKSKRHFISAKIRKFKIFKKIPLFCTTLSQHKTLITS